MTFGMSFCSCSNFDLPQLSSPADMFLFADETSGVFPSVSTHSLFSHTLLSAADMFLAVGEMSSVQEHFQGMLSKHTAGDLPIEREPLLIHHETVPIEGFKFLAEKVCLPSPPPFFPLPYPSSLVFSLPPFHTLSHWEKDMFVCLVEILTKEVISLRVSEEVSSLSSP